MGHVTLTGLTALAFILINNRYIANDTEMFLEEQIAIRTKELIESEGRFRSLVNNIPGVTYRCGIEKYFPIVFLSQEIERLTGIPDINFLNDNNKTMLSLIPIEDQVLLNKFIRKALDEKSSYRLEHRILDKEGQIHWVLNKGNRILEGEKIFVDGVMMDITEEKRLAQDKEQLEHQYLQAQKMESVGRLAGGIAHDINNLLTPIMAYADLLSPLVEDDSEEAAYVKQITKASTRARDLVTRLLVYSRQQKQEYTELDLNETIDEITLLLRETLNRKIKMIIRTTPQLPFIMGNRNQWEQVVMNLAVNAGDAMPNGGVITIETHTEEDQVVLAVSDTGLGMSTEITEHMFEPFYTTKGMNGTGLGLATVYGIVERHKAKITVSSQQDRGTEFRIAIPIAQS